MEGEDREDSDSSETLDREISESLEEDQTWMSSLFRWISDAIQGKERIEVEEEQEL